MGHCDAHRNLIYSILLYCLTQHFINSFTNPCDITCYNETEDYALDSQCNIFLTKHKPGCNEYLD